ncbi:MAG TPA: hypothetical protein VNT51_12530, partial [Miltoncostaeaceae bacterium]|nr:hypothetical protein [Miltoncostaeaceae bacterium]
VPPSPHPDRLLLRPVASLALAEQHGMLDGDLDEELVLGWVRRALEAGRRDGPDAPGLPDPAAGGIRVSLRREPGAPAAPPLRHPWERWPGTGSTRTLRLATRRAGEPVLRWEGTVLMVRLAPAEQVTLALSSSLTEDMTDHFALVGLMPNVSREAAAAGNHPLVTPSRPLVLTHAVRRPLRPPAGADALAAHERAPGDTHVLLDAVPGPLTVHAGSTAQLDVRATWTERDDDAVREVRDAAVGTVPVSRGQDVLAAPLHHEFGDTRHRSVRYALTALSRFRGHFPEGGPPDDHLWRVEVPPPVAVLSTSRPAPPVVTGVHPAFTWSAEASDEPGVQVVRRLRAGGRLRVRVARPWHVTGDGERLAVLVWHRTEGETPAAAVAAVVTEAGRDPIWAPPGPDRWPTAAALAGGAGDPVTLTLPDGDIVVGAVPFAPVFGGDGWYADVALPTVAAAGYCPLVRLVVARFQPHSIPGHAVSTPVVTGFAPLLPDRTLTVTRRGARVTVLLAGTGPAGPAANRVEALLERAPGPDAAAAHLSALGGAPDAFAWSATGVRATGALDADLTLELPPGTAPLRVRVREVEHVGADAPSPAAGAGGELGERVVFTDLVPLAPPA